ncbi:MAG TPA: selenocysteine-specific translation elongation factor [Acidimicrobiales bacterium]|nr:selenocysteine-specific translation elongation factor [Acidimicrobiales bacterium]
MRVVATAGHVDHGKSTLVRALTGTDPDRWAEEKARGLTIDLGFAFGPDCAFVDVPGHVRFLKNMLAGVGAVDACLFVVDSTEGWKPQSEEHLRVLSLLGLRDGVVAVTKSGADIAGEVRRRVAGTFLAEAELVAVDAVAGTGVEDVASALRRMLARLPPVADSGRPRLWVDRSFPVRGAGTVVTGTLSGGRLAVGDELGVCGRAVRVRGLQTAGVSSPMAEAGTRVAVNLVGVSHGDVRRGDALVLPSQWEPTRTVDCSFTSLGRDVTPRGAYLAYLGSGEHAVRLQVLGGGCVRLHLPAALPLVPGDRYVLRDSGRSETVGGGEVLDVAPVLPAKHAAPSRSVERVVAERGWVDVDVLERLTGQGRPPTVGRWAVSPTALAALEAKVAAAVDRGVDVATFDERERAVLDAMAHVEVVGGRARRPGPHPVVAALEADPFAPPVPTGATRAELDELARRSLLVECDGVWFSASAVERAAHVVAALLAATPTGVTVSEVRAALGTSRKYALPLLAHLDRTGVTVRVDERRRAGPHLPGG